MRELNWLDLFPDRSAGVLKLTQFLGLEASDVTTIEPNGPLRFNGLYRSAEKTDGSANYFRFYEDGTVLSVSIGGPSTIANLAPWFTRENKGNHSRGRYLLNNSLIQFSVTSSQGTIDYEGEALDLLMRLRFHSHINGNRGVSEVAFLPFPHAASAT